MTSSLPAAPPGRLRRSLLSVPAINARALQKLTQLDCDGAIFDLEDSVAPARKQEGRDALKRFFAGTLLPGCERIVRINALDTPDAEADIDTVLSLRPDALLLPKVESAVEIETICAHLDRAGAPDSLKVWAMVETPRAVLEIGTIAAARHGSGARLEAFVIGLNDLRKQTGILPQPGRTYLVPLLMQVVLAARAHGLDAIDSVFNDFSDAEGFEAECAQGRAMGFSGKMLIHPAQLDAANRHFAPSAAEIKDAEAIVTAFAMPGVEALNVVDVGGRMVERLHLEQAEKLLSQVRQIEARRAPAD